MDVYELNSGPIVATCLVDAVDKDSNVMLSGRVVAVYVELAVSCPTTPTITITTKNAPIQTILSDAMEESGWRYPRTPVHLASDGSVISNVYSLGVPIHDYVNVELDGGLDGDNVTVYLYLE